MNNRAEEGKCQYITMKTSEWKNPFHLDTPSLGTLH